MGEPWERAFIRKHASRLNFVACGANAKDTLWPGHFQRYRGRPAPDFEERWQNHTELSLRLASPGAAGGADTTAEVACGPVAADPDADAVAS